MLANPQLRLFNGQTFAQVAGVYPFGAQHDDGFFVGGNSPGGGGIGTLDSDPTVTVMATGPWTAEPNLSGFFQFTRTGPTTAPLTVYYAVSGTASNGTDYQTLPLSITIPMGFTYAVASVVPIDDTLVEGTETVIVTLQAGPGYQVGSPNP